MGEITKITNARLFFVTTLCPLFLFCYFVPTYRTIFYNFVMLNG